MTSSLRNSIVVIVVAGSAAFATAPVFAADFAGGDFFGTYSYIGPSADYPPYVEAEPVYPVPVYPAPRYAAPVYPAPVDAYDGPPVEYVGPPPVAGYVPPPVGYYGPPSVGYAEPPLVEDYALAPDSGIAVGLDY